jgi:hypothetical protein
MYYHKKVSVPGGASVTSTLQFCTVDIRVPYIESGIGVDI